MGRAHNFKFICPFALFRELFQCLASLVPCSVPLSRCLPFQPLPFMPALKVKKDSAVQNGVDVFPIAKADEPAGLFVFE